MSQQEQFTGRIFSGQQKRVNEFGRSFDIKGAREKGGGKGECHTRERGGRGHLAGQEKGVSDRLR